MAPAGAQGSLRLTASPPGEAFDKDPDRRLQTECGFRNCYIAQQTNPAVANNHLFLHQMLFRDLHNADNRPVR